MWRRLPILSLNRFLSTCSETPSLHSFLQPTIFALNKPNPLSEPSTKKPAEPNLEPPLMKTTIEDNLQKAILSHSTDEAWRAFKLLCNNSIFPGKHLTNSLISHLSSLKDTQNLKRAFSIVILLLEKDPQLISLDSIQILLEAIKLADLTAPCLALMKAMLRNKFYPPFDVWGPVSIELCCKNSSFPEFLKFFNEICSTVAMDESLNFMKPDLPTFNAALEACCRFGLVTEAENVFERISDMGLKPNSISFSIMARIYSKKGLKEKILELQKQMHQLNLEHDAKFYSGLIIGYISSGDLKSASLFVLQMLREGSERSSEQVSQLGVLDEGTYKAISEGFLGQGKIKELAKLIMDCLEIESKLAVTAKSFGSGVIDASIGLGFVDKAHSVLDEMNAQGASVGIEIYTLILKAYCKDHRTTEATQLVSEIGSLGLRLDAESYETLIDIAMTNQDFQSAFSLFRDMREARIPTLKMSYLTIMAGLTENHRPELMAAFLDEVVSDPRVEVGTHDWNSVIHSYCKLGRLEDARRTFRRMVFLHFEPNEQTFLSLAHGYCAAEKFFSVLLLWTEMRKRMMVNAAMQVVEKTQELKIFVDKWRYKQVFMETHKKLKLQRLRKKNYRKVEAILAFKNWVGLIT
ncbi:pentatricopeptide repeat-containing protein At1g69290 isoform X2 [Amborella trichopoda]|uniref:pentatricopeptide repeat-containing protein At1g69290 isoform X2 n=1 Tax=Amborella trichopoda TaxID=13333 RepID=UPI0009C09B0F|nr:pentatricopeptide repeat-containing protein At1g69290 isoform X2 [Amborella trichopoda]|eukprot:XP_020519168.1 pentatricopeptide repeat-containing protein At1g69290 isoform X2 [Amborella trichopoda]